jgi:Mn2+/Fe2+ NRAMP family transporter
MARKSKKTRAVISGIGVGLASVYIIANHFNVELNELNRFMLATLALVLGIVLLAAVTVLLLKGLSRLLRGKDADPQATSRDDESQH